MRAVRAAAVQMSPALYSGEGTLLGDPLRSGEGVVVADLDFAPIDKRKHLMDGLLSLLIDRTSTAHIHERAGHPMETSA